MPPGEFYKNNRDLLINIIETLLGMRYQIITKDKYYTSIISSFKTQITRNANTEANSNKIIQGQSLTVSNPILKYDLMANDEFDEVIQRLPLIFANPTIYYNEC